MKLKILILALAFTLFIPQAFAMNGTEKNINVTVNGNEIVFADQQPVIINERTLLPIRSVMEAMGKSVAWEAETSTVVISDSSTTVRLSIGSDIMYQSVTDEANGGSFSFEVPLDTPPMIINDRTCLPVRAVAEAFMATVDWDASTGTVMIITADLLC